MNPLYYYTHIAKFWYVYRQFWGVINAITIHLFGNALPNNAIIMTCCIPFLWLGL